MRAFCLTFARGGYTESRKNILGENDMTKTKRNLILVVSLLFAIFTLCSVFAGVSFHTPQTVEATETLTDEQLQYRCDNPGLYETGTTTFVKDGENDMTWDYLLSNGPFTFKDGHLETKSKGSGGELPEGDLVCGKVEGLTNLNYGFYNCQKIISIDMTNLDTANVTDMSCMTTRCDRLKEVDMSGLDTSRVTSMKRMFYNDNGVLEKITFGKPGAGKVTDMSEMFSYCKKIVSLDLSWMDTSSVTNMSGMFSVCYSLANLNLQDFNTKNVTNMSGMFGDCKSLTSLDVSGFDTSRVTDMSGMFNGCENLDELDLRNFKTENVKTMESMFYTCLRLKTLDLSSFNTQNVRSMRWMFDDCIVLKTIELGNNFKTDKVNNMLRMFNNCAELTSLDVTGFNTGSVENMERMFAGCKKLTSLDVSGFDTSNVTDMTGMFSRCESLTSLNVSNFVTTKVTLMMGMFANMKSLKSLDVGNFNTSQVTAFGLMFSGTNLAELDLRNFDFSSTDSNYGTFGLIGESDETCVNKMKSIGFTTEPEAYEKAMNNENISEELKQINEDFAELYEQDIVGKTGDELGYAGKINIVGRLVNMFRMLNEENRTQNSLDLARGMFETKIGKIYLPATAASVNISLPGNTTYVAKSGDTEVELEQQILYGYKDLDMKAGTVLVAKTAEVENTGVKLDTKTIIIACVIAGACVLAIIAVILSKIDKANKRKNRKF